MGPLASPGAISRLDRAFIDVYVQTWAFRSLTTVRLVTIWSLWAHCGNASFEYVGIYTNGLMHEQSVSIALSVLLSFFECSLFHWREKAVWIQEFFKLIYYSGKEYMGLLSWISVAVKGENSPTEPFDL